MLTRRRENVMTLSDTRLQVMWNRLLAVVEEQGQALIRAAFSPIVRECGDISAGIFDVQGRMLAQAVTGTPGHINTMAEAVKTLRARFRNSKHETRRYLHDQRSMDRIGSSE